MIILGSNRCKVIIKRDRVQTVSSGDCQYKNWNLNTCYQRKGYRL